MTRMRTYPQTVPTDADRRREADYGEEDLRQIIEMLFFAYRDFTGEPDAILARLGLGRAHHRAIYFIGRNPGATVAELLGILKITKQSFARVLSRLMQDGYIRQRTPQEDRRRRLIYLTDKGIALEQSLTANQRRRIEHAYSAAGPQAAQGFRDVLLGVINQTDRWRFRDPGGPASHAPPSHSPASHAPASNAPVSHAPVSNAPVSHD